MADQTALSQWTAIVGAHLSRLSTTQVRVLALWRLGMVLSRSCALTAVSLFWATALGQEADAVRQRLRAWCDAAADKAGAQRGIKRRAAAVADCFVPLLRWVLSWWEGPRLALALDATTLGTPFVVLAVSVVDRGCAVPVGWVIVPAGERRAWEHAGRRLLRRLRPAVPAPMRVIVLADRGPDARWLVVRIHRLGWHPFRRVHAGGTFRPDGGRPFRRRGAGAPTPDSRWQGTGTACQGQASRRRRTLLARRQAGCAAAWLILTDLPPEVADAGWDGLRAWVEPGFKIPTRGGWPWQRTQMTDPDRAARLRLAVAAATLGLLSVGGAADAAVPASTLPDVTAALAQGRRPRHATRLRLVSVFRRGRTLIRAAVLNRAPLPTGRFAPEPWPTVPHSWSDPTLRPHLIVPAQEAA